jgi:hypothetical protein
MEAHAYNIINKKPPHKEPDEAPEEEKEEPADEQALSMIREDIQDFKNLE